MKKLQKVLYTAHATSTGGREGISKSDDGKLNIILSTPEEMGGTGGDGTNPEQLFAAGYSSCFVGALKFVASQKSITLSEDTFINAEVSIGPIEHGFGIAVRLHVNIPEMEQTTAEALVAEAHTVCPYSNATRGNIEVTLKVN